MLKNKCIKKNERETRLNTLSCPGNYQLYIKFNTGDIITYNSRDRSAPAHVFYKNICLFLIDLQEIYIYIGYILQISSTL